MVQKKIVDEKKLQHRQALLDMIESEEKKMTEVATA